MAKKSSDYLHGETQAHLKSIDKSINDITNQMRLHNKSDRREFKAINSKLSDLVTTVAGMKSFWAGAGWIVGAIFGVLGTIIASWITKRF